MSATEFQTYTDLNIDRDNIKMDVRDMDQAVKWFGLESIARDFCQVFHSSSKTTER
jgi:hypothetical protein